MTVFLLGLLIAYVVGGAAVWAAGDEKTKGYAYLEKIKERFERAKKEGFKHE